MLTGKLSENSGFEIRSFAEACRVGKGFSFEDVARSKHSLTASVSGLNFDIGHLEKAAEVYNISSNPEDYFYSTLFALTADLPNRNLYNFSLQTLNSYNPIAGCLTYKTFEGKPTYLEHVQEYPKARGIILGSTLVHKPPYHYVMLVQAYDKKKDYKSAFATVDPKGKPYYSMGSNANALVCMYCGHVAHDSEGSDKCSHVKNRSPNRGKIIKGRLMAEDAQYVTFGEQSKVAVPADCRSFRAGDGKAYVNPGKQLVLDKKWESQR